MKKVPTLTLEDTLSIFRAYGVPMSYERLKTYIDSGAVQWAVSARKNGEGNYQRTIFRVPLVRWLESMSEEVNA